MASIFSTQNLQTFLRRKYLRPPGPPSPPRPPGPPGPVERGGRRSPRSGLSAPAGRSTAGASGAAAFISSAMMLLKKSVVGYRSFSHPPTRAHSSNFRWPTTEDQRLVLRRHSRRFSCSFGGCGGRRSLTAGIANGLDLVPTLLLFVNAHSQELDYGLSHAQPALKFMNQSAATLHGQQHVNTVAELANNIGQVT